MGFSPLNRSPSCRGDPLHGALPFILSQFPTAHAPPLTDLPQTAAPDPFKSNPEPRNSARRGPAPLHISAPAPPAVPLFAPTPPPLEARPNPVIPPCPRIFPLDEMAERHR